MRRPTDSPRRAAARRHAAGAGDGAGADRAGRSAAAADAEAPTPRTSRRSSRKSSTSRSPAAKSSSAASATATSQRATTQVISVLSTEDIARTGEGDIAGALGRVTGLSVVGGGFVYVRGLGDRYSLALLNGSPLPSPEPLRRAVPLDLFPTDVIASSLVQKTYSANFPGEFGGGVINLTTLAVPRRAVPDRRASVSAATPRPPASSATILRQQDRLDRLRQRHARHAAGAARLLRQRSAAQRRQRRRRRRSPASSSMPTTAWCSASTACRPTSPARSPAAPPGTSATASWALIATAGYSNKWRTRDNTEQTPASRPVARSTRLPQVVTDNRIVANALLGLGYEFGEGKLRWTNLYVHDTLKQAACRRACRTTSAPAGTSANRAPPGTSASWSTPS